MTDKYYAYYDLPTGTVLGVTLGLDNSFEYYVEILYEEYQMLASGREKFYDYYIGAVTNQKGEIVPGLISKKVIEETLSYRSFSPITTGIKNPDITVDWKQKQQTWVFKLSKDAIQKYYDKKIPAEVITFYVTLETDYDFLVRMFNCKDVNQVYVPKVLINMRIGGMSNKSFKNLIVKSFEDYQIIKKNKIGGLFTLINKNFSKLGQFFNLA
jgi:glycosyltransferase